MSRARRLLLTLLAILALGSPLAAAPLPVGGRVTGPRGEPVAGVRVALVRRSAPHELAGLRLDGAAEPEPAARAETDRQGRFELKAPEIGMWKLTLEAKGYLPLERDLAPLLDEVEVPAAVLAADTGLEVRVADEAGRPLAARLIASRADFTLERNGAGWSRAERLAAAGPDGIARLPHGAGERLRLVVAAAGRPPVRLEVAGASARVVLAPGVPRGVRVLDERGRPAAGALVLDGKESLPLGRTEADGRWTAAVPARGDLLLRLLGAEGRRGWLRLASATPGAAGKAQPEEATVRLEPRRTVSGRVVDRETRRPLPGALVWSAEDPAQFARTDKAGGYSLPVGAGPPYIQGAASGYVTGTVLNASRRAEMPTLALLPAGALEGVVVDGAGRPVAGAELAVELDARGMMSRMQLGMPLLPGALATRSGAAGRFRLPGVPAGMACTLAGSHEGLVSGRLPVAALGPLETRSGLRLVLGTGRRGAGLVVDRAGRPVAGAKVTLSESAQDDFRRFTRRVEGGEDPTAWTDAAGRFALSALSPSRYDLAVEAEGFAPVQVPGVEVPKDAGPGEVALGTITLSPGASLAGRVVDDRKQPVAGAEVRLEEGPRIGGMRLPTLFTGGPPRAVSDADGRFTVRGLRPGGSVSLMVEAPGHSRETVPGVTAPATAPIEVVLRRSGRVSGRVLDADRKPVEEAMVTVRLEAARMRLMRPSDVFRTEADGRFELENVEPGSLTVEAEADDLQSVRLGGLELAAGGELAGLELVMEPGAVVEGRVLAANGLPVVGAQVMAGDGSAGGFPSGEGFGFSDGDGRYRLDSLAPGHVTITAQHAEHGRATGEADVRPGVTTLDLTFEGGFEVSGRVVDSAGEPVAGAELMLMGQQRFTPDMPRATSAADGSFSFSAVSSGTYNVMGTRGTARLRSEAPVEVRNAPVAGVVVRLELGRAVLSGRLAGVSPAELGDVSVRAVGAGGMHQGQVDFRGTYKVEGLAPGDWSVRAEMADGRSARGKVAIPEGATEATLDLDFSGGLTLSGVTTRGGEPVAGASVILSPLGAGDRARTETDASGAFRLANLAPGRYRLEVVDQRTGLRRSREVELTADRRIEIALAGSRISGHVRDAVDGKPLVDAAIEVKPADEGQAGEPSYWSRQSAASDSRGYFSFGAVAAGRVRVVVTRAGYGTVERILDLGEEGAEDVDFQLQATEGIRFQAVTASGLPAGAVLLAVTDASGRVVASGRFETGEGGEVRVSTVPAGSWELLVREMAGGTLRLPITAPGALGRIQLPAGGDVEVTVPALDGGTVAATLTVRGPDGRPYREPGWGGVRDSWPVGGGQITLSDLPPGTCTVTVTAADGRTWTGTAEVTPGGKVQLSLR